MGAIGILTMMWISVRERTRITSYNVCYTKLLRRPLQGSCGGLANAMGDKDGQCSICGRSYDDCPEKEPAPSPPAES